eukprot:TRINITY_DN67663_c3_g3_i2.p1 TRINITY_DN67663_c3_g3~~TRINITY_DN67663_c3_g3_i2.p1  ORF type:complete len:203 (+),score=4.62 TRINITY_DN67663_c3_g3_i2:2-610(+)
MDSRVNQMPAWALVLVLVACACAQNKIAFKVVTHSDPHGYRLWQGDRTLGIVTASDGDCTSWFTHHDEIQMDLRQPWSCAVNPYKNLGDASPINSTTERHMGTAVIRVPEPTPHDVNCTVRSYDGIGVYKGRRKIVYREQHWPGIANAIRTSFYYYVPFNASALVYPTNCSRKEKGTNSTDNLCPVTTDDMLLDIAPFLIMY